MLAMGSKHRLCVKSDDPSRPGQIKEPLPLALYVGVVPLVATPVDHNDESPSHIGECALEEC
jgi:hypothetical protein